MEKKPEYGYGGEMPPPYTPAYGQPGPVGVGFEPPPNTAPVPPPPGGFIGAQSMYAQQQAYAGAAPPAAQVVQVVQFANLRSRSTRLVCPACRADVSTRVSYRTGRFTHLAAIVLCFVCCPIFCIPYCMEECQDAEHYCPNCQQFIGIYRR